MFVCPESDQLPDPVSPENNEVPVYIVTKRLPLPAPPDRDLGRQCHSLWAWYYLDSKHHLQEEMS